MKKLFAIIIVVVLICAVVPFTAFAAEEELYYGRSKLFSMANGEKLVAAYDAICRGVAEKESSIDLWKYGISVEELKMVYAIYRNDRPEHYWLPGSYIYSFSGSAVVQIKFSYLTGFDHTLFEAATAELLTAAEGKTTDYDKAIALHDALVKHITYDGSAANAHNAYGAIVGKRAVCEGYAEAYQYLLGLVGVQAYTVTGEGDGVPHEWNLVRLDGKYYYTDLTWDDPIGLDEDTKPIFYAYFNISTAVLQEDHIIDDTYGILPYCENSLFNKDYVALTSYTVDGVAAAFKKVDNLRIARIYYNGSQTDNFNEWLHENYSEVAKKIGVPDDASMLSHGREHYVVITVSSESATLSGSIKSLGKEGEITVLLFKSGENEPKYKTVVNGTTATEYSFSNIACGTYTVRVIKADHILYEGVVTAKNAAVKYNIELKHCGDVTGNGRLDAADLTELTRVLLAQNEMADFDVDGNGVINILDLIRIKRHLAE
ncbi:MAG: hypothetical protein IKD04_09950 [Clostridia bacterium]|nr:hypothetical protein [Clostridia bacterium]